MDPAISLLLWQQELLATFHSLDFQLLLTTPRTSWFDKSCHFEDVLIGSFPTPLGSLQVEDPSCTILLLATDVALGEWAWSRDL